MSAVLVAVEVLCLKDLEHSAGFGKFIRSILRSVKIRDKNVSLFIKYLNLNRCLPLDTESLIPGPWDI